MNKYKEVQIGQSRFSIPRHSLSLLFCIPNINFLSYMVVEILLTTNVERKKNIQCYWVPLPINAIYEIW